MEQASDGIGKRKSAVQVRRRTSTGLLSVCARRAERVKHVLLSISCRIPSAVVAQYMRIPTAGSTLCGLLSAVARTCRVSVKHFPTCSTQHKRINKSRVSSAGGIPKQEQNSQICPHWHLLFVAVRPSYSRLCSQLPADSQTATEISTSRCWKSSWLPWCSTIPTCCCIDRAVRTSTASRKLLPRWSCKNRSCFRGRSPFAMLPRCNQNRRTCRRCKSCWRLQRSSCSNWISSSFS